MNYEHFEEGTRPLGAPFELIGGEPESPWPKWEATEYEHALLVVAHQDDETIFAGGLLLAYPEWDWTVITVTDSGREEAQDAALARLGRVRSINLGFSDGWHPQAAYRREILDALCMTGLEPDITFTHGYRGEYGHHAHVWTHHAAHMVFPNVWDFLHPCERVKQLRKTRVREVFTDERKRDAFYFSYGAVALGLRDNAPWVTCRLDSCMPEYFTQAVVGI